MYSTYILYSEKDKRTYVGYSKDLATRLFLHNSGRVKSTKHRRPLRLLHCEEFNTEKESKERERWWKSSGGRKELAEFLIF
ncbi:MAG: GIY-YIG nuclease family protein [Minisyncoccota bacterium]